MLNGKLAAPIATAGKHFPTLGFFWTVTKNNNNY